MSVYGFETNACNIGEDGDNFDLPPDMRFPLSLRGAYWRDIFSRTAAMSRPRAPRPRFPIETGLDDLLVWMTRADLARRMREADVFPLIVNDSDRPPVFFEPE